MRPFFVHPRMWPKWLALGGLLAAVAWTGRGLDLVWILPGLAGFLVIEYAFHRWLLHGRSNWSKRTRKLHAHHHVDPRDPRTLFLPWHAIVPGPILWAAIWAATGDVGAPTSFALGLVVAMMWYEGIHFRAHEPGIRPRTAWGRRLRAHHLRHHAEAQGNFGIAGRSLDRIFGTRLGGGHDRRGQPPSP